MTDDLDEKCECGHIWKRHTPDRWKLGLWICCGNENLPCVCTKSPPEPHTGREMNSSEPKSAEEKIVISDMREVAAYMSAVVGFLRSHEAVKDRLSWIGLAFSDAMNVVIILDLLKNGHFKPEAQVPGME